MNPIVNFYLISEDEEDSFEELAVGIKSDNSMYFTLQVQDTVIPPNDESTQYTVAKIVKNFYSGEMDVYLSKTKNPDELLEEIGSFANETLKTMFGSLNINIQDLGIGEEPRNSHNKDDKYVKEAIYEEIPSDKLN
ncbi:hypothetical protein N4T77_01880 [Clostridium sp. CX1]|uniref:Uncharacterized protein n=1 Tax=Clostridium tanneri TaxID=3037988 RepID=A0ABU4JTF5_9CLOT|nr:MULTISPECIES: hypothetical protein [unclassified Clostridium]MCT8975339.1 hypothetical protein [Clostridium sp. CX1]MDW8801430.1 hypothetical protein [Clostridium sp. A1-XYC3]